MTRLALVTGASGFIGPALCQCLKAGGWTVRAVMRQPAAGPWDEEVRLGLGTDPIPPDLMRGVDCVFHLAGRAHAVADGPSAEEAYRRANLHSTTDLLAAAHAERVRGFVYFSSVKAIGEQGDPDGRRAASPAPSTPYGRSKRAAECAVLTDSGAVPHAVVLRPALVYGPRPKGHLELMIKAIRAGWFPPLPCLDNRRSMIHRDDLVAAALVCANDPRARGRAYVVTDGPGYTTRDVYLAILDALGRSPPAWHVPFGLLRLTARIGDAAEGLLGRRLPFDSEILEKLFGSACYDGEPIRRDLGFQTRHTLAQSIAEMVETTP
jgi:nucleoside-diphosphate-sugar epimerase